VVLAHIHRTKQLLLVQTAAQEAVAHQPAVAKQKQVVLLHNLQVVQAGMVSEEDPLSVTTRLALAAAEAAPEQQVLTDQLVFAVQVARVDNILIGQLLLQPELVVTMLVVVALHVVQHLHRVQVAQVAVAQALTAPEQLEPLIQAAAAEEAQETFLVTAAQVS
jgi:BarA-like signal transduction histidine kinase